MGLFDGKRIFITGSCGTIGSELVRELLSKPQHDPLEVVGVDNDESSLFFQDQNFLSDKRASFYVADIRDEKEITNRMRGSDIVIHAAALKHVVLCERSPEQAVQTNIVGLQNIISAAIINDVDRVIFTSSDKAVNPTNVMGTTKLMGERLMTAANNVSRGNGPVFASTRFGNVLGSSGSVIPIFRNQILEGGPLTLTDRGMTRFVMSISEAVELVLNSVVEAKGGEVFVTKMPVLRIEDLAVAMSDELSQEAIEIIQIGSKPGEKLYEELMSEEETRRTVELERFFSVLPAFRGIYSSIDYDYPSLVTESVSDPYVSERQLPLTVTEIKDLLKENGLLERENRTDERKNRYWPGDKEEKK